MACDAVRHLSLASLPFSTDWKDTHLEPYKSKLLETIDQLYVSRDACERYLRAAALCLQAADHYGTDRFQR